MGRTRDPDSLRSRGVDRHRRPRMIVHLPQDVYDALRAMAAESGATLTAEVTAAVAAAARRRGHLPAQRQGPPE